MLKKWGIICFVIFLAIARFQIKSTHAGVYSDDLTKCIVEASSVEDQTALVKWMFSALSLHPSVSSMVSTNQKQRDEYNKQFAELIMRLLTVSCKEQTRKAWKYEGQGSIQTSFSVLGQVAAKELFAHPKVEAGLDGIKEHFDEEKLKSALSTE